MVPVHDTDVAESRWSKAEWEHYELWEKVELRARRRKRLWVAGAILLFLLISAVPIVRDRGPKWGALASVRRLGQEINRMKLESARARAPHRIRFEEAAGGKKLEFVVEQVSSCASALSQQVLRQVQRGSLGSGEFVVLSREQGEDLAIPGLTKAFCYDPVGGAESAGGLVPLQGFGIALSQDIAEKRTDRLAVLVLSGASAEPSFD